jgi:hypothetical protein
MYCLLRLLVFQYCFWLFRRMSFSVVLRFSVVLQGFLSLVPVYLYYEYLLLVGVKKILCV